MFPGSLACARQFVLCSGMHFLSPSRFSSELCPIPGEHSLLSRLFCLFPSYLSPFSRNFAYIPATLAYFPASLAFAALVLRFLTALGIFTFRACHVISVKRRVLTTECHVTNTLVGQDPPGVSERCAIGSNACKRMCFCVLFRIGCCACVGFRVGFGLGLDSLELGFASDVFCSAPQRAPP